MLRVFYYYYYLFYTKVLVQPEPHFVTVLALSASEGFLINAIMDYIAIKFYCTGVGKWPMIAVFIALLAINFFIYGKNGKEIVKERPTFFGSTKLSIVITSAFFLITTSWLFWGAVLGKHLLEQCQ